ncbi:hypothetical protein PtA15_7A411 [Puccinia triticina]|uniref:Uncharacterized protein n=1 Tax=Puccinia triticina TaxID=208348 RepID=A0ABY7CQT5_9BASI|nr:uncharacterized protein PtA15_7A411 [Puccinia triticina]WAQ86683.1 hypothetical protein PtA15_7A411 [Puccinia triticina]
MTVQCNRETRGPQPPHTSNTQTILRVFTNGSMYPAPRVHLGVGLGTGAGRGVCRTRHPEGFSMGTYALVHIVISRPRSRARVSASRRALALLALPPDASVLRPSSPTGSWLDRRRVCGVRVVHKGLRLLPTASECRCGAHALSASDTAPNRGAKRPSARRREKARAAVVWPHTRHRAAARYARTGAALAPPTNGLRRKVRGSGGVWKTTSVDVWVWRREADMWMEPDGANVNWEERKTLKMTK